MKNCLLVMLLACSTLSSLGQIHEIGFFIGGTNYMGDIGRTNFLYPNKPAAALIYKWNMNPRVALRATYSYLPIEGDDKNADTDYKINRGLKFSNTINELAIGLEFNFQEFDMSSVDKNFTPYILIELAAFNYKYVTSLSATNEFLYQNKNAFAIPFGIGYKSKLFNNFAFAIETKFRYTFEDDLDYSTPSIQQLNYGTKGKDWYVFTGFSLVYTFGRPPCYSNRN